MSLKKVAAVLLVSGFIGLIGCNGNNQNSRMKSQDDASSESSSQIKNVSSFQGEISPEEELALLNKKVVYFDYDSSGLSPSDERLLSVHAKYLLEQSKLALRIEGNTDNRGSREYNVALGERRGKAVERFMQTQGVPANRMEIVSYGKEKPASLDNTEAGWALNRRAELAYEDRG